MAARRKGKPSGTLDAVATDRHSYHGSQSREAKATETFAKQDDFPPLSPPPGSLDDFQLWFDRLGRVGLASVVPLMLILAVLPRTLFLVGSGELCVRRGLYHPRGLVVPCSGLEEPSFAKQFLDEWRTFAFAVWVSLQFWYNFVEACYREPGYAKHIPEDDVKTASVAVILEASLGAQASAWYAPRWCGRCNSWKTVRVHHSSKLGRCIERMDHYCSTVENVVGGRNHGHFVLMVFFATTGLVFGLGCILRAFIVVWNPFWKVYERRVEMTRRLKRESMVETLTTPVQVFNLVLGMDLLFFLIIAGFAIYLLCPLVQNVVRASSGTTILETLLSEKSRDQVMLFSGKTLFLPVDAFSQGSRWRNLRAILGPKWLHRCLFPVRGGSDPCNEATPRLRPELEEAILRAIQDELEQEEDEECTKANVDDEASEA